MIDKNLIGKKIQQCRCSQKMTQEELAEAVEISSNYLSKIERGLSIPSADILLKIIEVLNIELKDFEIFTNSQKSGDKIELEKTLSDCSDDLIKLVTPALTVLIKTLKNVKIVR